MVSHSIKKFKLIIAFSYCIFYNTIPLLYPIFFSLYFLQHNAKNATIVVKITCAYYNVISIRLLNTKTVPPHCQLHDLPAHFLWPAFFRLYISFFAHTFFHIYFGSELLLFTFTKSCIFYNKKSNVFFNNFFNSIYIFNVTQRPINKSQLNPHFFIQIKAKN